MTQSLKTTVLQAFCTTGPAALQEAMLALAERIEQLENKIETAMRLGELLTNAIPQEKRDIVVGIIKEALPADQAFLGLRTPEDRANVMAEFHGQPLPYPEEPRADLNMPTSGPLPNTDTAEAGGAA